MEKQKAPKFLVILMWIFNFCALLLLVFLLYVMFSAHETENTYVIKRTNDYPPKFVNVSREYTMFSNHQFVPIKSYNAIGTEYFCTIEMVDSSFIVDYTSDFLGNFHMEGMRFYVWNLIESTVDSTFIPIRMINGSIILNSNDKEFVCDFVGSDEPGFKPYYKNRVVLNELPDTIKYMGLKIYNIETWTLDKYIDKTSELNETASYETEEKEGKQTF